MAPSVSITRRNTSAAPNSSSKRLPSSRPAYASSSLSKQSHPKVARARHRLLRLRRSPTRSTSQVSPELRPHHGLQRSSVAVLTRSARPRPDPLSGAVATSLDWDQDFSTINLTQTIPSPPPTDSLFSDDLPWATNTIQVNDELTIAGWSASKNASTSKWWEDRSTFCKNKQQLYAILLHVSFCALMSNITSLEIFFSHRHQCAFDCHLARFRASLHLTPPHQPHPALMDAIYLMACYFSRLPQLSELEPHFLKRALAGISEALHQQDRMVQVLQASSLIAVYFFCQGRVLEGYYHSSTSARLAIDVGLHQIRPTTEWSGIQSGLGGMGAGPGFPTDATFPLPPVKDPIEHAERVAAFWQIFIVDRAWSVATGLPSALPDDDHPRTQIATTWPMGIADMSMVGPAFRSLRLLRYGTVDPDTVYRAQKQTSTFQRWSGLQCWGAAAARRPT